MSAKARRSATPPSEVRPPAKPRRGVAVRFELERSAHAGPSHGLATLDGAPALPYHRSKAGSSASVGGMAGDSPFPHQDLELVRRALAGDARASGALIGRLGCVYRVLAQRNRRLGEPFAPDELEDQAQDVTIAVWTKLGEYRGLSSLEGWICRFAHLELIYRLRRRDRLPRLLDDARAYSEPARDERPAGEDHAEELYPALEDLDPAQGEVIRLKHFEDLTFPQIAERVGASANTAKTRYYRGLQRLREILERGRRRVGEDVR